MNTQTLLDTYCGRLEAYTTSAKIQGPCGDTMEAFLEIDGNQITNIKFFTEGCIYTNICAATLAQLAHYKTIPEALDISVGDLLQSNTGVPVDHLHCNILAVSTLYRALAIYLLDPTPTP